MEEAYLGKKQNIQFSTSEKCNTCKGNGLNQVQVQIDVLIVVEMEGFDQPRFFTVQQTCPQCAGSGEEITNPCNDCGAGNKQATKKISVSIPKGVDDGTRIRLQEKVRLALEVALVETYTYL